MDILHLEDDDDWAALVRLWLAHEGWTVQRVALRREFAEVLEAGCRPRCFLLDLSVPDGDGLRLCAFLKDRPALQSIPIVILTASDVKTAICLRHQAMIRIQKGPESRMELTAALKTILLQQERMSGLIQAGDLELDARTGEVFLTRSLVAALPPGPFAALTLLVMSAPSPVDEGNLYSRFLTRGAYGSRDGELTAHKTVTDYVSRLRKRLGPRLSERIVHVESGGYVYRAPDALDLK